MRPGISVLPLGMGAHQRTNLDCVTERALLTTPIKNCQRTSTPAPQFGHSTQLQFVLHESYRRVTANPTARS